MKVNIVYSDPIKESDIPGLAEQLDSLERKIRSRTTLNKVITIPTVIYLFFSVTLMFLTHLLWENLYSSEFYSLLNNPLIGSAIRWSYNVIIIKFSIGAILRGLLFIFVPPLLYSILCKVVFSLFTHSNFSKSDSRNICTFKTLESKAAKIQQLSDGTSLFSAFFFILIAYIAVLCIIIAIAGCDDVFVNAIYIFVILIIVYFFIWVIPLFCVYALFNNICLSHITWNSNKFIEAIQESIKKKELEEKEQQRRQEEEERERKRLADLKEGEELYQRAISGAEIDENMMEMAAAKGNPQANLHVGMAIYSAIYSELTRTETEELCSRCKPYFKIASDANIPDGTLLYISTRVMTESHTEDGWVSLLQETRRINKPTLSENLWNIYDTLIKQLVKTVDQMAEAEQKRQLETTNYTHSYSSSKPFNAYDYVRQKTGLVYSSGGIDAIRNDPNLTASQKEEALRTYRIYSD